MSGTYWKYKSLGLCCKCGSIVGDDRTLCIGCREKKSRQRKRARELAKNPQSIQKPILSLEKVNRMAMERGISYGQMVALLETEKG